AGQQVAIGRGCNAGKHQTCAYQQAQGTQTAHEAPHGQLPSRDCHTTGVSGLPFTGISSCLTYFTRTPRNENWRRIPRSAGSAAPRSSPVAGSGTSLFPGVSLRMSSLTVGERSTTAPSQLSIPPVGKLLFPPLISPLRTEHGCSRIFVAPTIGVGPVPPSASENILIRCGVVATVSLSTVKAGFSHRFHDVDGSNGPDSGVKQVKWPAAPGGVPSGVA